MRRLALACLLASATLLPVQAEAAKIRLSGRSSASTATRTNSTVVIIPGVGGATRTQAAETGRPARVPVVRHGQRRGRPFLQELRRGACRVIHE